MLGSVSLLHYTGRCPPAVDPISLDLVAMQRNAKQKFTFSDGTIIPAGAKIGTPSLILHRDPTAYEDGDAFDGFRFSKKGAAASSPREAAKFSMVSTAAEYQIFGHGKHAW